MPMAPRCFALLLASALAFSPALALADDPADDPPQAAPRPPRPPRPPRHSVPMAIAGAGLMALGIGTMIGGYAVIDNNKVCVNYESAGGWFSGFRTCTGTAPRNRNIEAAGIATMVGGALVLAVGIPLLVLGLEKKRLPPPVSALLGKPAPGGWGWSF